jgi:hypothetical protein
VRSENLKRDRLGLLEMIFDGNVTRFAQINPILFSSEKAIIIIYQGYTPIC